ncbi:MAG: DUF427 domain-containing protein [Pseudomonadota bacterium]
MGEMDQPTKAEAEAETPTTVEITLNGKTIHRPDVPAHFMRLKPVDGHVRIQHGDTVLVETSRAIRLTEVGRDVYDPVIYVPKDDVAVDLNAVTDKSSKCPLKGQASYFAFAGVSPIAWQYAHPFGFAAELADLIAFYPNQVTTIEIGADASQPETSG